MTTPKEALKELFPEMLKGRYNKLSMDVEYEGQLIKLTLENITKPKTRRS